MPFERWKAREDDRHCGKVEGREGKNVNER